MNARQVFVRPTFAFDKEFGMFRNWWVRDARIRGNPLSIYLYLISHAADFKVSPERVRTDLEMGKDAFRAARRKLEQAGFIEAVIERYPAGYVDADGVKLGGQVYGVRFEVRDPERPSALAQPVSVPDASGTDVAAPGTEVSAPSEPVVEPATTHAGRVAAGDGTDTTTVPGAEKTVENIGIELNAGNPTSGFPTSVNLTSGFPPVKEDKDLRKQSSSSSLSTREASAAVAAETIEDDSSSEHVALARDLALYRVELVVLSEKLRSGGLDATDVRLVDATVDVLSASKRRVGDPTAYVATAILREPQRWSATLPAPPGPASLDALGALQTAPFAPRVRCSSGVHDFNWDADNPGNARCCLICAKPNPNVTDSNEEGPPS